MIRIGHPETEATGTCTEAAYERVWKAKGWVKIEGEPTGVTTAQPSMDQLTKEQLVELGRSRGLDVNMRMAKDDLVQALSA